jgi:hypothetical protein
MRGEMRHKVPCILDPIPFSYFVIEFSKIQVDFKEVAVANQQLGFSEEILSSVYMRTKHVFICNTNTT